MLDFQKSEVAVGDRRAPTKLLESGHPVLAIEEDDEMFSST